MAMNEVRCKHPRCGGHVSDVVVLQQGIIGVESKEWFVVL
jgi:hypothetical protein